MISRYSLFYALKYILAGISLSFKRFFKVKYLKRKIYDFDMFLDTNDIGISQALYLYGDRELQLKYILSKEIKPGYRIIDLGANLGYYPLIEYQLLKGQGKIFALEPSPSNFKTLEKNILHNRASDLIETFPYAGGEKSGKEKFYLSTHSNVNTMIPKEYSTGKSSLGVDGNYIEVEVIELSSFIKKIGVINLIRMDIEGYEVEVLSGLRDAIESGLFSGQIVFECHSPKYDDSQHSIREQLNMLFSNGYFAKYMTSIREQNSTFHKLNYKPIKTIRTSVDNIQGIYQNISNEDAEYLICDGLGVRDILLEKQK
tara:strand:+ start:1166 stop:2107 length:942 start_codon:yes stop_codon:yes gene_type:complete